MSKSKLLTTLEAAEHLGIKRSYLNKLMMQKEIPYYKPHGKLCFFDVEDLDNWLRRVRISSNEEIEQKVQDKMINS